MWHRFPAGMRAWCGIELNPVTHTERIISAVGGFLGILFVLAATTFTLGERESALLIVASMGASAVLLFAVPHGPRSQPWSLLGGHGVSALIGVACAMVWIIRFVAILVDGLIVFAPISLLFHSVVGMSWFFSWWWIGAVLFFYSTLFDLAVGGTVGKLLMHLKSVSVSGQINTSQAVLRNITKVFPPLLLIDWVIGMAIDTNDPRQKWTDTLARTSVIRYDVLGRT